MSDAPPGIMMREALEAEEHRRFSPQAAFADLSRGREHEIPLDPYRTEYQRDRDRIIHCKAFRRLAHKTQVFLAPDGDHYRTRMTHTLEVSQISRSIARALAVNEDLVEAIALGHDLGHTPFGHTGESALDDELRALHEAGRTELTGYQHNVQSLRIVEELEYDGKGLNLTWEVRDGILGHTGSHVPGTHEGQIVRTADRIAYVNHDIDDAVRAGVLRESDLPSGPLAVLGPHPGARMTTMINDMVLTSANSGVIGMSPVIWDAMMELRAFLFDNVYFSPSVKAEEPRFAGDVQSLFRHFLANPDDLPADERPSDEADLAQSVIDYVSGMTDRFAIREVERLFEPREWLA